MFKVVLTGFFLLYASAAMSAGDVTGKIQVVSPHTHPGWDGVMIQMEGAKIFDPTCGNSSWALIKVETELDKVLVSVALTAKTTRETVRVYTGVCSRPPVTAGIIPVVEAIDFGIRN